VVRLRILGGGREAQPYIDPCGAGSYNRSVPAALSFCCRFAGMGVGWIEANGGRSLNGASINDMQDRAKKARDGAPRAG
jgi:hypothetical protein